MEKTKKNEHILNEKVVSHLLDNTLLKTFMKIEEYDF